MLLLRAPGSCFFMTTDSVSDEDRECSFVWTRAKTASTYWFFTLRYGALVTNIPVIVFSFVSLPSGKMWSLQPRTSSVHAHHGACCFSDDDPADIRTVRTQYACALVVDWNSNMLHGTYGVERNGGTEWLPHDRILRMPLVHRSICFISLVVAIPASPNSFSCLDLAISWECLFAFDSVIFGLTIYNAYSTRRRVGPNARMPLHKLMVRDGAMYFAAMALANLANIITFLPLLPGSLATFAVWYILPTSPSATTDQPPILFCSMSVTMMSRLMLNLHERTEYGVLTASNLSEVEFEIDNIVRGDDGAARSLNDVGAIPILPRGLDAGDV
ncbi:hypothetical protein B0H19DRAFT_1346553 [Mycena capillaripes]|nr:hypothetical protein B0H19DRAFT_1346553 [Mycena capillaripes]